MNITRPDNSSKPKDINKHKTAALSDNEFQALIKARRTELIQNLSRSNDQGAVLRARVRKLRDKLPAFDSDKKPAKQADDLRVLSSEPGPRAWDIPRSPNWEGEFPPSALTRGGEFRNKYQGKEEPLLPAPHGGRVAEVLESIGELAIVQTTPEVARRGEFPSRDACNEYLEAKTEEVKVKRQRKILDVDLTMAGLQRPRTPPLGEVLRIRAPHQRASSFPTPSMAERKYLRPNKKYPGYGRRTVMGDLARELRGMPAGIDTWNGGQYYTAHQEHRESHGSRALTEKESKKEFHRVVSELAPNYQQPDLDDEELHLRPIRMLDSEDLLPPKHNSSPAMLQTLPSLPLPLPRPIPTRHHRDPAKSSPGHDYFAPHSAPQPSFFPPYGMRPLLPMPMVAPHYPVPSYTEQFGIIVPGPAFNFASQNMVRRPLQMPAHHRPADQVNRQQSRRGRPPMPGQRSIPREPSRLREELRGRREGQTSHGDVKTIDLSRKEAKY